MFLAKLKAAWRSKTVWFNLLLAAAWAGLPDLLVEMGQMLPTIRDYLPQNTYGTLVIVAAVGNTFLRFLTKLPLEAK
jgi:hypothetical protein